MTTVRRPSGTGKGLDGPACPQRATLPQKFEGTPVYRMCMWCSRVTPRSDGDGLAWCGGELADEVRFSDGNVVRPIYKGEIE